MIKIRIPFTQKTIASIRIRMCFFIFRIWWRQL